MKTASPASRRSTPTARRRAPLNSRRPENLTCPDRGNAGCAGAGRTFLRVGPAPALHMRTPRRAMLLLMKSTFSPSETSAIIRALQERRTTGPLRFDTAAEPDHAVVAEAVESARWAPNHKRTEP